MDARKVLVIGGGPAGVSAAIYARREGADVTLLARDGGTLGVVREIENYYGFPEPISGAELLARGRAQAARLGVTILDEEVVSLTYDGALAVETVGRALAADAVVLATGALRKSPGIPGIARYEGLGVSHCAVCDGFFFRGKDVGVLGAGAFAMHEVRALLPIAKSVTLFTGGAAAEAPEGVRIETRKITGILGEPQLTGVALADGTDMPLAGLFIALGVAGSVDLAARIGAMTEDNRIVVDADMATNVPGLYAAGDCTGGARQVAQAVYQGMVAGMAAGRAMGL